MRPSQHVDADDTDVAAILTETVELVLGHGGSLHPDVVIVERDHDLHLELRSDDTPEQPIVTVPADLLVPLDDLEWAGDDLTLARPPTHLAPATAATLDLMLELFRTCDKLRRFAEVSPRVAAASDARLADALAVTRFCDPSSVGSDPRTAFLQSRTLGAKRRSDTAERTPVLMPVIDAIDHDPDGAPFGVRQGQLTIGCHRPMGGVECLAQYGIDRDPLDLATIYGFTTERARMANCVPTEVELPSGHVVRVEGLRPHGSGPPEARRTADGLHLGHLTFRAGQQSQGRTYLQMAITAMLAGEGVTGDDAGTAAAVAYDSLLEQNERAAATLLSVSGEATTRPWQLVGEACRLILDVLTNSA